jgi:hypothetical protein
MRRGKLRKVHGALPRGYVREGVPTERPFAYAAARVGLLPPLVGPPINFEDSYIFNVLE